MGVVNRGFQGRGGADEPRLPPGQHLTDDFPVLSASVTPLIAMITVQPLTSPVPLLVSVTVTVALAPRRVLSTLYVARRSPEP